MDADRRPTLSSDPPGLAAELMSELARRAASGAADPADRNPYAVRIVAAHPHGDGDGFTVVYRQLRSPRLLGRRGRATAFSDFFSPRLSASRLAAILLQALSEPGGPGRPGPPAWPEGLVDDPAEVRWLPDLG